MGTQENPDISILWFNDPNWIDLTNDSKSFTVENGGIREIATASLELRNQDGKYSTGANKIVEGKILRITVDVRDSSDIIFEGRIYRKEPQIEGVNNYLKITGRGRGQQFDEDSITYGFSLDDSIKDAIEYALANPDSKVPFGATLYTDEEEIITTQPVEKSPRHTKIGDFIRDCIEQINYDGYISHTNYDLYLYKFGTQPCNPTVTLNEPYRAVKPLEHIEDYASFVMIHGGTDAGIPLDGDWWTEENATTRYSPALWGGYSGATMHDSNDSTVGNQSVECRNWNEEEVDTWGCKLFVNASEYYDMLGYIDARNRFKQSTDVTDVGLHFHVKPHEKTDVGSWNNILYFKVKLVDSSGNTITYKEGLNGITKGIWNELTIDIGTGVSIAENETTDQWYYEVGETFDWQHIAEIWFEIKVDYDVDGTLWQGEFYLDELRFLGGYSVDGLTYPDITPYAWAKDVDAILYPVLYHHEDQNISSFDDAYLTAQQILEERKQKFRKFEVALSEAKPWIRNGQTVTFTLDDHGISAETWVIVRYEHEWKAEKTRIYTTLEIMPLTV